MSSGRIASLLAAAIGLVGMMARMKSPNGGTAATAGAVVSAAFNAAADSPGIGNRFRIIGINIAPITADSDIIVTIHVSDSPAIRPARADSAVWAMPVMSSDTTSGTIVMRRALSHSAPMGSAMSAARPASAGSRLAPAIPSARPRTRARRIRVAFDIDRRLGTAQRQAKAGIVRPFALKDAHSRDDHA